MRFRKRLFTLLTILALVWIAFGFFAVANYDAVKPPPDSEGGRLGRATGNTFTLAFFLCSGLPCLLTFSLLAWRNSVGLATERRHQEQLEALRAR